MTMGEYGKHMPANQFPEKLTPEQAHMLKRGMTTETMGPMDFFIPGGIGAAAGRFVGRNLARAGDATSAAFMPTLEMLARAGGYNSAAGINLAGRIGAGIGGAAGLGVGAQMPGIRAQQNTMRDAEGQPGGYYGQMAPGYYRDAEGQPGGFYGGGQPPTLADILQGRGR